MVPTLPGASDQVTGVLAVRWIVPPAETAGGFDGVIFTAAGESAAKESSTKRGRIKSTVAERRIIVFKRELLSRFECIAGRQFSASKQTTETGSGSRAFVSVAVPRVARETHSFTTPAIFPPELKSLRVWNLRAPSVAPSRNYPRAHACLNVGKDQPLLLLLRNQRFLLLLLAAGCALAQTPITTVNLATQGRNVDFANFPFTRPVSVGASLPSTCQIGQLFFNTTAAPGANLYGCTSTNTWTALASSSNTAVPQVSLNPASLSFGTQTVGTTSAAKTVTLTNSGVSFLSVSAISLTGTNASDFLVSNNCGTTVPSGASCTITVTFQPSTTALETAAVSISGNEPGSPVLISLTGSGTAAITSGGLVITPSASYAAENGSVTLTANRPVNWAMISGSAGTLTANSSTSATYSAPGTIA